MPIARKAFWPGLVLLACLFCGAAATAGRANAQTGAAAPAPAGTGCPPLLKQQFKRLQDEAPQDLCQYTGKVVLVVNTASYCGFTNQYEGLEALYARLGPKGLVVLGFPSNDFGQQEPGNNKQIADFCFNTYAVKFPMFSKTSVLGKDANPLFAALTKTSSKAPTWNFHKYLLDRRGKLVGSYPGEIEPGNPALLSQIEKALAEK